MLNQVKLRPKADPKLRKSWSGVSQSVSLPGGENCIQKLNMSFTPLQNPTHWPIKCKSVLRIFKDCFKII